MTSLLTDLIIIGSVGFAIAFTILTSYCLFKLLLDDYDEHERDNNDLGASKEPPRTTTDSP